MFKVAADVAVTCHSHGWPDPKQTQQLKENHLAPSLLHQTYTLLSRLMRDLYETCASHKQSTDEQHSRARKSKGKSKAQQDAANWLPASLKLAYDSKMQTQTELLGTKYP